MSSFPFVNKAHREGWRDPGPSPELDVRPINVNLTHHGNPGLLVALAHHLSVTVESAKVDKYA